jgi:sugar lactone lactonase YvrE
MRGHDGDPTADLLEPGPVEIGRFELRTQTRLPSLRVGREGDRSGVWDVLAHPNGRIYFTTFYESAGYVEASGGPATRLEDLGVGLNELALGPDGTVVASRYATDAGGDGTVVHFDAEGTLLAEHRLPAVEFYIIAPKTVAFDPVRGETWVTTDGIPNRQDLANRHDTFVLDRAGRVTHRIADPEIQFVAFAADGTGYVAEVAGRFLHLRVLPPGGGPDSGSRRALDDTFRGAFDFVQDIHIAADGRVVVTRWSGAVHVLAPDGRARQIRLPPDRGEGGLYYSGVVFGDRICVTHCAGVEVVCDDAP